MIKLLINSYDTSATTTNNNKKKKNNNNNNIIPRTSKGDRVKWTPIGFPT